MAEEAAEPPHPSDLRLQWSQLGSSRGAAGHHEQQVLAKCHRTSVTLESYATGPS